MIIIQATIHTIEPFDASIGTTINFTWNGNQIQQIRCLIKLNETGNTVYDDTVPSMKQTYTIPPNSGLKNGSYYVAYITVFDIDGTESDQQSIGMPFYCFTTPTFELSVTNGMTIDVSTYSVELSYEQIEDEPLDYYQISLYNYQRTLMSSSGTVYNTDDMTFLLTELENANQYYVRATGTTLHGMNLDTGEILITVAYTENNVFSVFELNNIASIGGIEIRSNIVSTEGVPDHEPVIYIDGGGVDLRDNGVTFSDGFWVDGDFTIAVRIQDPNLNMSIVGFTIGSVTVYVYYREGSYEHSDGRQGFFELNAEAGKTYQVANSNYFDCISGNEEIVLYIQRIDSFYSLHAAIDLATDHVLPTSLQPTSLQPDSLQSASIEGGEGA